MTDSPKYDDAEPAACAALVAHLVTLRIADMAITYRRTGKICPHLLADTAAWAGELSDHPRDDILGGLLSAIGRRADVLDARDL